MAERKREQARQREERGVSERIDVFRER